MANNLTQILTIWHAKRDQHDWVIATIYETDGSSYRKPGSHMMINDMGQYFGLLSGGCLESDIMRQARRCWDTQHNRLIQYDMREEEDIAWQMGIGCGGLVKILLQPVNAQNAYLSLDRVLSSLINRGVCSYQQIIKEKAPINRFKTLASDDRAKPKIIDGGDGPILEQVIGPAYHLTIIGGGVDARPVARLAVELGWEVVLVEPRTSHGRKEHFPTATNIVKRNIDDIYNDTEDGKFLQVTNAVVVMSHSIEIDAQGLHLAQKSSAKYVGMLGPIHRTLRVFERAKLTMDDYPSPLANPIGLRLGGELPESIALSIVSEIHAFLENADGKSISGKVGL